MSFLTAQVFPVNFQKSLENRSKDYRLIVLKNGLLTLLVCDPSVDNAACSIVAATGSHKDPSDIPGFAHYCEHMLCSGTKQFPGSSFMDYVTANGGDANAFTTGEQTCFYFEAPVTSSKSSHELVFDCALRNFSTFFKSPAFTETALKQEIVAINSEHESNINDLSKILYHGLRILANNDHPFLKFSTGNSATLAPKHKYSEIRTKLYAYFNENFTTEKLTLVIKGPQSLNALQKLVISNFSEIRKCDDKDAKFKKSLSKRLSRDSTSNPNIDNLRRNSFKSYHDPFNSSILKSEYAKHYGCKIFSISELQKMVYIKSSQHSCLQIIFPLPECPSLFQDTWCNIIGDESKYSLIDYLSNSKNYISKMYVFTQTLSINDKILILNTDLTKQGIKNLHETLIIIFSYIQRLTKLNKKYLSRYMSNLLIILKQNYYHQDSKSSSMDEASELAMSLQQDMSILGIENLLKGFPEIAKFDYNSKTCWYSLAQECIDFSKKVFSMNNFNMLFVHSNVNVLNQLTKSELLTDDIEFSRFNKEPYYNFDFQILHINSLKWYQLIEENHSKFTEAGIQFPNPINEFNSYNNNEISQLIKKISVEPITAQFLTKKNAPSLKPILVEYSKYHEVWFKSQLESSFLSKVYVSLQLNMLELVNSPKNHICAELLCELISYQLSRSFYNAEIIGYSWGIFPILNGNVSIAIKISGVSQGIKNVVSFVVNQFKEYITEGVGNLNYKAFRRARINLRKVYVDLTQSNGITQGIAGSLLFLEENIWGLQERLETLELLDVEDLKNFTAIIARRSTYSEVLVTGDCSEEFAVDISNEIGLLSENSMNILEEKQAKLASSYLMEPGSNYIYSTENLNKQDPLNTICYYIQLGQRDDIYTRSMAELISYFLSSRATFELRTRRQLGYTVFCNTVLNRKVIGVNFTIMSSEYDGIKLLSEIEEYLSDMQRRLCKMNDEEFRNQILQPFLVSYEEEVISGMATNIVYSTPPSNSSGNFNTDSKAYCSHNNDWVKIVEKNYRFGGKLGHDEIDKIWIESVTKQDMLSYFVELISIDSPTRSSLVITINSALDKLLIQQDVTGNRLREYLSEQGIDNLTIDLILEKCNGDLKAMQLQFMKFQFPKWKYIAATCKVGFGNVKSNITKHTNLDISTRVSTKLSLNSNRKAIKLPSDLHRKATLLQNLPSMHNLHTSFDQS